MLKSFQNFKLPSLDNFKKLYHIRKVELICYILIYKMIIWRPPSLSELTPMLFNMGLTHLGGLQVYFFCVR